MAKGLIGIGREQKRQAMAGLTRAAELETQTNAMNRQLKAQKTAAELNVAGTGVGIAGASLLAKRAGAKALAAQVAAGTTTAAAGTTTAAAGVGAGGGFAALLAAAPWAALIIGGGFLLKKLFD